MIEPISIYSTVQIKHNVSSNKNKLLKINVSESIFLRLFLNTKKAFTFL